MNGKAPAQAQPTIEERNFTEAESRLFQSKSKAYNEAFAAVNEMLAFLREQHNVNSQDGWQLGEKGFFRQVAAAAPAPAPVATPAPSASAAKRGRPKLAKAVPPVAETASVNGVGAERG